MRKLVKGFSQYINECGCEGTGALPEDGTGMDMGLGTTGTGIKDQVDATGSVMEEDEEGEEGADEGHKEIGLTVKGETIEALLHKIKELSDSGVSFEIKITPEGEEESENFIWDGDGDDAIASIDVEGEEEEEGTEEPEEGDEGGEEFGGQEEEEEDDDNNEGGEESEETDHKNPFEGRRVWGKKVNETFTKGETVGGVKVPGMIGPKTGGKTVKIEEKTITQKNKSFPISGPASLKKAEHAFGRSKDKAKTKKHIVSSAKELGISSQLSDKWKKK